MQRGHLHAAYYDHADNSEYNTKVGHFQKLCKAHNDKRCENQRVKKSRSQVSRRPKISWQRPNKSNYRFCVNSMDASNIQQVVVDVYTLLSSSESSHHMNMVVINIIRQVGV